MGRTSDPATQQRPGEKDHPQPMEVRPSAAPHNARSFSRHAHGEIRTDEARRCEWHEGEYMKFTAWGGAFGGPRFYCDFSVCMYCSHKLVYLEAMDNE